MSDVDWDDPDIAAEWERGQRARVQTYLAEQRVPFAELGLQPDWAVAPYVALWLAVGPRSQEPTYWVITGDCPTDFLPASAAPEPRSAMDAFAQRWAIVADYYERGEPHPSIQIGPEQERVTLGALLRTRASLLARWAADADNW